MVEALPDAPREGPSRFSNGFDDFSAMAVVLVVVVICHANEMRVIVGNVRYIISGAGWKPPPSTATAVFDGNNCIYT